MKNKKNTKEFEKVKKKIVKILKKYHIEKAGIFGSYARGGEGKRSDIDILVQPPRGIGFQFAGIQLELEKTTRKKIDLVTYKGLSPYLKKEILEEEIRII